jgi:hypothetical protein
MFSLANTYAKLKKTTIIAYDLKEDGTIVFVVEAGGKYKMTREELEKAIRDLTPDLPTSTCLPSHRQAQAGESPFEYIEKAVEDLPTEPHLPALQAGAGITPQPKRRKTRS